MLKYISLDKCDYSWYFSNPPVLEADLKNICPFSEEYGSEYWTGNISDKRHLMLVDEESFTREFSLNKMDYDFFDDWNSGNFKGLSDFLLNHIDLPPNELIVFFWNRSRGLETTWDIFLRNWINFLYDDVAPILLCPRTKYSILFGPQGNVFAGYKRAVVEGLHFQRT